MKQSKSIDPGTILLIIDLVSQVVRRFMTRNDAEDTKGTDLFSVAKMETLNLLKVEAERRNGAKGLSLPEWFSGFFDRFDTTTIESAIGLLDQGLGLVGQGDLIPDNVGKVASAVARVAEESADVGESVASLTQHVGLIGMRIAKATQLAVQGNKAQAIKKLEKAQAMLRSAHVEDIDTQSMELSNAIGELLAIMGPVEEEPS